MKRRLACIAGAMLGIFLLNAVAVGASGSGDYVSGGLGYITEGGECCTNTVSAHSDPQGGNPHGYFTSHVRNSYIDGEVTCLNVSGNRATIGIRITHSSIDAFEGRGEFISFEDNGNPVGGTPVDGSQGSAILPVPPTVCPPPPPAGYVQQQGNIIVNDS